MYEGDSARKRKYKNTRIKKGIPVPVNIMEANKGTKVTPALLRNLATTLMVCCRTVGALRPEQRVRVGFRAGMDVLENDNHPNSAGTRPWTVESIAPS